MSAAVAPWLALIPGMPLLLAFLLALDGRGALWRLTPLAVLPALLGAVLLPVGASAEYSAVLLGAELALDPIGRGLLLVTALLWGAAAVFAQGYLGGSAGAGVSARLIGSEHRHSRPGAAPTEPGLVRFHVFFLLAMAGNLGLILAGDAMVFYAFFALMSLSSVGLVVHERTREAWRAGWVYLGMTMLGEVALFSGLVLLVHGAGGHSLAELASEAPASPLAAALLLIGLGIKAGLLPLHLWLPLAHPAAPTPASAVLSGAMIKAGLLGWMRLLPEGEATLWVGDLLVVLGLLGAWFGVVAGVFQSRPKTILAYSSISQMGLMIAGLGVAIQVPALAPVLMAAVGFYAMHHGLAKGALFLCVGIAGRVRGPWILAYVGLPALALAGLPLTSGWVAKTALKVPMEGPLADLSVVLWVLTLAAAGTTLLMVRLVAVMLRERGPSRPLPLSMSMPWLVLVVAGVLLPWFWVPDWTEASLDAYRLWSVLWPMLLGLVVGLLGWAVARWRGWGMPGWIPEGDVWVPLERLGGWWLRVFGGVPGRVHSLWDGVMELLGEGVRGFWNGVLAWAVRGERRMVQWEVMGVLFLGLVLGVFLVLALSLG
ncbi:complex I subunit 5 family protein [Ectothiorhodospira variabilis]|uniref:complex I subunit 5 family protein n=1 Tax=Ectothiorhodospira variabilis TaxID=505694 RepID=UPI001EFAB780|nr:complex I subunit 5 family protein [Ectothiorhodospira variabilis]MCG5496985.1 complex I subunit 5 family protein [Ectothiorhodospira variabilis]